MHCLSEFVKFVELILYFFVKIHFIVYDVFCTKKGILLFVNGKKMFWFSFISDSLIAPQVPPLLRCLKDYWLNTIKHFVTCVFATVKLQLINLKKNWWTLKTFIKNLKNKRSHKSIINCIILNFLYNIFSL